MRVSEPGSADPPGRPRGTPAEQTTVDAAQTAALGGQLAAELRPGDVVLVTGEMGSGKTTFVRGALRALGVTGAVTSPTFTIGRRYDHGRVPVSHLDLHRLGGLELEDPALIDDYVDDERITFVEWPEVAASALASRVVARVALEHAGGDRRAVRIERQQ